MKNRRCARITPKEERIIDRVCPNCGRVLEETWNSCPHCGRDLSAKSDKGTNLAILSIILAVVSFVIFGIPLGIAAVICGSIAVAKGDDRGIISIVLGIIGALIAILIMPYWLSLF